MNIAPVVKSASTTNIYSENINQCLKETYYFTNTTYYNICDGSIHVIPVGFWVYLVRLFFIFCIMLIVILCIYLLKNEQYEKKQNSRY